MGQRIQRYLAMACAAAALACVAAWLFAGAPNVPRMNLLIDPAADTYVKHGYGSSSWYMVWGLAQASPLAAYLSLFTLSASIGTAAVLSLILLLRSDRQDATRFLGLGLGWWSLSLAYLGLFITLTPFLFQERWPFALRVALDMAAFMLLFASTTAVVHFWHGFPRAVSDQDLYTFLRVARGPKGGLAAALSRLHPTPHEDPRDQEDRTHAFPLWLASLLVLGLGFCWRGGWYVPGLGATTDNILGILFVISIVSGMYLLGWPVFKCLRLLAFHRVHGSSEDRAKIEWIWTAIWIAVILFLIPILVWPVMMLATNWFPELEFEFGCLGTYLLVTLASAPFIVLVALALSVFYRGAIDPRLALKGFTVWTLLGVVLTLIFVFIERTVATRLVLLMHLPPQTGYVTAGAIVAATFQPIRKRMEKGVNRFVERVLPEKLLAAGKRGTAAVAVADIAGFTALSAKDEQAAILASALLQKEARRLTDQHGGRVVKSTGDGVILLFTEPGRCLGAVQDLHRSVAQRAAALDLPPLLLHSGVNWGEVVEMHDGDIYGMTVNVAARIADWAQAGEIGISEALAVALPAPAAGFEPQGPQRFKNVPQPVSCLKRLLA
jgi:class 3 adenylate cyclase